MKGITIYKPEYQPTNNYIQVGSGSVEKYEFTNNSSSATYMSNIQYLMFDNMVLKTVTKNLWETYKYNQEYITFLLGGYTKEQFMKIAKDFAVPSVSNIDVDEFVFAVDSLIPLLDSELSTSDISVLLNVDCDQIEEILNNSQKAQLIRIDNPPKDE